MCKTALSLIHFDRFARMSSMHFLGVQKSIVGPIWGGFFVCKAALPLTHFDRFARMSSMHFFGVQKFAFWPLFGPIWGDFGGLFCVHSNAAIKILDTKVQVDCHEWCSPGCCALVPYTFLNHFGSRYKR